MSHPDIPSPRSLAALPTEALEELHSIIRGEIRRRAELIASADFGEDPVTVFYFCDDKMHRGDIAAVRAGRLFLDEVVEAGLELDPNGPKAIHPDDCDPADLLGLIQAIEAKATN